MTEQNPQILVSRQYHFEAARQLDHLDKNHPCARLHGHSFALTISVGGKMDSSKGWIMDFAELDKFIAPIISQLDHRYLNDIKGLEMPTSEHIALWIWHNLKKTMPEMKELTLKETHEQTVTIRQ